MHDGVPIANAARRWRMLYLDPALVGEELQQETTAKLEIARPVLRDPQLRKELERLFGLVTGSESDPLEVDESITQVLALILHRHSGHSPHPQPPASVVQVRQRLDDEPCAAVSLAELAAMVGVSRFQLIRGFSREVGATPYAYQVQRRVRLARRLIVAGRSLADAAVETGFSDQSHLTRAFVRQTGVTPARYRAALA
jgi:AraC-like DNA-binding protein